MWSLAAEPPADRARGAGERGARARPRAPHDARAVAARGRDARALRRPARARDRRRRRRLPRHAAPCSCCRSRAGARDLLRRSARHSAPSSSSTSRPTIPRPPRCASSAATPCGAPARDGRSSSRGLDSGAMALRICLVTPFAWSQPHEVNEHVAGVAQELRALGHAVTILASSNRAADLAAGRRRAAQRLARRRASSSSLGPAVPISRRSRVGVPVGVRTNLSRALARGRFDVVHGFEPALPSLSYLALRDAESLDRRDVLLARAPRYPPGRAQRERLLGRIDALLATSEDTAAAAAARFPGDVPRSCPRASTRRCSSPRSKERLIVLEWRPTERPLPRAALHTLGELPDWRLTLLRTKPLADAAVRPAHARRPRRRAHRARLRRAARRSSTSAAIFVPATTGMSRARARGRSGRRRRRRAARHARAAAARGRRDGRGSPTTTPIASGARARRARCGRAADVHRRRARARGDLREPARRAGAARRRDADPLGGPRLDRRRPPHAHERVARLPRRARAPARARGGRRPRRDRDHRPQRLLRRAGGRRARARPRHRRHPRRGGEDGRAGRGDRPLPARGDPARDELRRHDRGDQGAGRPRLSPPPVRPHARDPRRRDAAPPPRARSTCSRSTTPGCSSRPTTTRRCASPASTT